MKDTTAKPTPAKPVTTAGGTEWHHLDARNQVLGRLAGQAAALLMGKHRADWAPHKVAPVVVVITNSDKVAVTGNKEQSKTYTHYSGYPGGLKQRPLSEQRRRDSRVLIREAVAGMLPKNNLRAVMLKNLRIYVGEDHPHQAQLS